MFHSVLTDTFSAVLTAAILAGVTYLVKWVRWQRKVLRWISHQMANDGNGSWRSNINERLTAIEKALPGVTPKPEPLSNPPDKKGNVNG